MTIRAGLWARANQRQLRRLVSVMTATLAGLIAIRPTTGSAGPAPSLVLSPTSGAVGSAVSVTGYNFGGQTTGTLTFAGTGAGTFSTDRKGNFSAQFSVPMDASVGTAIVTAVSGTRTATKPFSVMSFTSTTSSTAPSTTSTTTTSVPSSGTPGTVLFGVSTPSGPNNLSELDAFEAAAGKRVGAVMYFQGWGYDEFDPVRAAAVARRGAIPEITWEPWDYLKGLDQPSYSLASIIGGAHDPYITRWAQGAKTYGDPLLVRFAHEMNDRHYPWSELTNGNQPGQYVAAWRHVVDIFRSVGATNVSWVWSPNTSYAGTIPLVGLYPGDGYVDWVAVDGYNGGTALPWGGWLSFSQIFGSTLIELGLLAPTKPVMIGETASVEQGGSKAGWIGDFFDQLAQRPQIKGFVWFEHQKEADWRIQSSASATDAFAAGVAAPRYG